MRTEISEVAGRVVVVVTGAADLSTVPALQNVLVRAVIEHPGETIAVDLDSVDTLDDTAMGVLLGAAGRARRGGGDLVIVCRHDTLRDQFVLTGLARALRVLASLTADESVGSDPAAENDRARKGD